MLKVMYAQEEHGKQHWDHLEENHLLVSDGMMVINHDRGLPRRTLHMHVQPHGCRPPPGSKGREPST
jgi:hypothetical protein